MFQVLLIALVLLIRVAMRATWSNTAHRVCCIEALFAELAWIVEHALHALVETARLCLQRLIAKILEL